MSETAGNRPGNMAALSDDSNKLVQKMMHPQVMQDRDKALGPSAVRFQPYRRLKYSTPELSAQFQPHQRNQKEVTTPVKHVLIPDHVKMAAGSLLKQQENCCRGFQLCIQRSKKRRGQSQRPVV